MANASSTWTLGSGVAKLAAGQFSAAVKVDQPGLGIHDVAWAGKPIAAVRHWLGLAETGPSSSERVRPLEDAYVRGRDLVAVYAETKDHPLRYVVYSRALGDEELCGAAAGLDVVVSVQTSVLDVTPAVSLGSAFSADRAWKASPPGRTWTAVTPRWLESVLDEPRAAAEAIIAAGRAARDDAFLFDLAGSNWSYAEMIHPQDRMLSYATLFEHGDSQPHSDADAGMAAPLAHTSHQILGLRLEKGVLLRARLRVVLTERGGAREVVAACREQFERAELPLTT